MDIGAMDPTSERLDPPNERAHFVLPAEQHAASAGARSHDSIVAVYPQGISFIDDLGAMEGFLTIIAGMGGGFAAWMASIFLPLFGVSWATLTLVGIATVCLFVLRADTIAYRYQPVLFNRTLGKAHCFVSDGISWWKLWQLKPASHIQTFDWSCIRGEVVEFSVIGGSGVPRLNYALVCAAVEHPGSRNVVGRFGVGMSYPWNPDPMVERWEHIRRFMRFEGPALAPGDAIFKDESTHELWAALTFGQPLLGPGSAQYWNGQALNGWWFLTIPAGLVFLGLLPFTVSAGLLRWITHFARREPKWPADILESVGGAALSPDELNAPKLTWTQQRKALKAQQQGGKS